MVSSSLMFTGREENGGERGGENGSRQTGWLSVWTKGGDVSIIKKLAVLLLYINGGTLNSTTAMHHVQNSWLDQKSVSRMLKTLRQLAPLQLGMFVSHKRPIFLAGATSVRHE